MEWMIYMTGGMALGACALAIYEWRKNLRVTYDDPQDPALGGGQTTLKVDQFANARAAAKHHYGHIDNPPL